MTVIAWDGKTLAADKRAGTDLPRTVTKIRKTASGALIGCTGTACTDMELMAWYEAGAIVSEFPPSQRVEATASYLIAIGSGRDFAMAAMHLGKSASEAVAVAIALTATCGNGIDTLELES